MIYLNNILKKQTIQNLILSHVPLMIIFYIKITKSMSIDKQNLRKKRNTNSISFRRCVSKLF